MNWGSWDAFWAMDGYHTIPCTDPIPKLNLHALTNAPSADTTTNSAAATPTHHIHIPLAERVRLDDMNVSYPVTLKYL